MAAAAGQHEVINLLLKESPKTLNAQSSITGATPLIEATLSAKKVTQAHNADRAFTTHKCVHATPTDTVRSKLNARVRTHTQDTVELLLSRGADPTIADLDSDTPVMLALENDEHSIAELLRQDAREDTGEAPSDIERTDEGRL